MALNRDSLKSDIIDAFETSRDQNLPKADAARMLAFAVLAYASEAEAIMAGPILIPAAPSPIPSSAIGQKVKLTTASAGIAALEAAILASYNSGDKWASVTPAFVAYAATFTVFSANGNTLSGICAMAAPPVFAPAVAIGLGSGSGDGGSIEEVADSLATAIHTAFLGTLAAGAVVAADGGVGAIVPGPLM